MENKFIGLINRNNCNLFKNYFIDELNKLGCNNADCMFCGFSEEGRVNLKFCVGSKNVLMLSAGDYNCNGIEYSPYPQAVNYDEIWLTAFGEFIAKNYANYLDEFIGGFNAFRHEFVQQKLQRLKRELDEQTLELEARLINVKNGLE